MHPQDLRTLRFLEEIEQNQMPSQRHLSRKLDVSLGLVNTFVKRLVQKGYLKISMIPKNRLKYILTPTGAAEKTRLTYEYIRYSFRFYNQARQKLKNIFAEFQEEGAKKIALYGSDELAEIAYLSLQETAIALVAVFDYSQGGKKFFGRIIENPNDVGNFDFDKILVTILENADQVRTELMERGVSSKEIELLS